MLELEPVGRFEWERLLRRAQLDFTVMGVGLVLATYADSDGSNVRPGLKRLIAVTGKSRATICRALATLRDLGLIDYVFQASRDGHKDKVDEYRLTMPADLTERIPLLGPDENQVSPMRPGLPTTTSPQRDLAAETRSHPCDNQVSPMRQPGLTGETPPQQDHNTHQPSPVVPIGDGPVEGSRPSTDQAREFTPSQLEIAAWQASQSRQTRIGAHQ